MDSKNIILLVIISTVFIQSGCVEQISSAGSELNIDEIINMGVENSESENVTQNILEITSFSADPISVEGGEISEVALEIRNPSEKEISVPIDSEGRNVITNYCPDIFDIEEFNLKKGGKERTFKDLKLSPDDEATLEWVLESMEVPQKIGCDLKVRPSVESSTSTYTQVEFKESEEVESSDLDSESDKKGSLVLKIESKEGGSYIKSEKGELDFYMKNLGEGAVRVDFEEINFTNQGLSRSCEDFGEFYLKYNEQESFKCDFELEEEFDQISQIFEVSASVPYRYSSESFSSIEVTP